MHQLLASNETDVTQERKTSPSLHKIGGTIHSHPYKVTKYILLWPRSVAIERSFGMREGQGLIPGRVKQKLLNFEILLLCFALSTSELE